MGKTGLSSVNLIVEGIELNNPNSLRLIENLESDLDQDQLSVDSICFDLIKNYKMTIEQSRYVFAFMRNAESLERIGDLCFNISRHLKNIIDFKEDLVEINELLIFGNKVKKMINESIISLVEKKTEIANESIRQKENIFEIRNSIQKSSVEIMKNNGGYIPVCIEIISICYNLEKIAKLSVSIAENTLYVFAR